MIKFECPHCDQRISAEPEHAGKESECPSCSGYIVIPFLSAVSENDVLPIPESGPKQQLPAFPDSDEPTSQEFFLARKVRSLHRLFGRMPPKVRISVIALVTLTLSLIVIGMLGKNDRAIIRADLAQQARDKKPFRMFGDDSRGETIEVQCQRCDRTGKDLLLSGCKQCRGAGSLTTPSGFGYLCPACQGTGRYHAPCASCNGSGKIKVRS